MSEGTRGHGLSSSFSRSADSSLARLVKSLTPRLSANQAQRLLAVLRQAQSDPPSDKRAFVEHVNRLFDIYRVRIVIGDGELYRLKYLPGGGAGHIYFLGRDGVNLPLFPVAQLTLVDTTSRFIGNKYHSNVQSHVPVLAYPK